MASTVTHYVKERSRSRSASVEREAVKERSRSSSAEKASSPVSEAKQEEDSMNVDSVAPAQSEVIMCWNAAAVYTSLANGHYCFLC